MTAKIQDAKVAILQGSLPQALRKAAEWIEENNVAVWNVNIETEDDGSYVVLIYFYENKFDVLENTCLEKRSKNV